MGKSIQQLTIKHALQCLQAAKRNTLTAQQLDLFETYLVELRRSAKFGNVHNPNLGFMAQYIGHIHDEVWRPPILERPLPKPLQVVAWDSERCCAVAIGEGLVREAEIANRRKLANKPKMKYDQSILEDFRLMRTNVNKMLILVNRMRKCRGLPRIALRDLKLPPKQCPTPRIVTLVCILVPCVLINIERMNVWT